jgi:transcriptional regulator with XRE-family HTH domain
MDFSTWLIEELKKRNWSASDLANAGGLNRQVIGTYINRQRQKPDPEILVSIARALKLPPETVFRAAGLLPQVPSNTEYMEQLTYLVNQLPDDRKPILLEYIRFLLAQVEAEAKK